MLNKFLQHGKGDPALAASYVLDDVDHLNVARADVQVLRGDPQTFAAIAESIENEWKYTSGAICWSVEDNPTDNDINEYLDAFEAHAFAGLQPHQYHFTAVLHEEDDGSKHVHFLVPRVELTTGKALNIAPPGHESYFDPLRDYFNYKKGWSRPDDPKLKRDTQTPDHDHFQQVSALKAGLSVCKTAKDIREVIGVYIEQRIQFGEIKNRHDVINALNDAEIGEITRISDNFISVKPLGSEKAIRLKGAFYESEFSVESYIENRTRKENDAGASNTSRFISEQDKEYAEELRARVTELAKKRAAYNEHRYGLGSTSSREHDFSAVREQELSSILTSSGTTGKLPLFTADATATTAQSTVSAVEQYQSRHIQDSKAQESPFYIKCDFSFDSSYFAYQQFCTRIRQQEQVQRDASERSTFTANRSNDTTENSRVQHGDNSTVQGTRGEINNDTGSAIIADYRRTATSAQTATRATAASISAYTAAGADYQRARELHSDFKRETQRSSASRETLSNDSEAAIRADNTTAFFRQFAERLTATAGETFNSVSRLLEHRAADHQSLTTPDADRNREAARTTDQTSDRENEFSRAISTKSSSFSATPIREALERVEQRQQKQAEKKQDYDSPRPF